MYVWVSQSLSAINLFWCTKSLTCECEEGQAERERLIMKKKIKDKVCLVHKSKQLLIITIPIYPNFRKRFIIIIIMKINLSPLTDK